MDVALMVLAALLVIAGMSAGLALGLHLMAPGWSERRRSLLAAGIATGLPMSIAFGGFFTEFDMLWNGESNEFALGLLSLVLLTLVLASIVCLPGSWWVTRKLAGTGEPPAVAGDGEETELISSQG